MTLRTMRQTLMKMKNPVPAEKKKGVVYEIPCQNCAQVYIGETGRILKKRIWNTNRQWRGLMTRMELLSVFQTQPPHHLVWSHCLNLKTSYWKRRVQEAINIRTKKETMNLDCRLTLSNTWLPSLELCRTSGWLSTFTFSLHPSLPVLSNLSTTCVLYPSYSFISKLCKVIADEGSRAEISYIVYAMSIKCSKELL